MGSNRGARGRDIGMALLLLALLFLVGMPLWSQRVAARYNPMAKQAIGDFRSKNIAGARSAFDVEIAQQPGDPELYETIITACLTANQPQLAVEYGEHGATHCKGAPATALSGLYRMLAVAYSMAEPAHPQEQAITAANNALRLDSGNPANLALAGYLLVDNDRDLEKATEYIGDALKQVTKQSGDSTDPTLLAQVEDAYGWLLFKEGRWGDSALALQQAVDDLNASGATGAGNSEKYLYYHLGAAYSRSGHPVEARNALLVALNYDPTFPQAAAELAALPPPPAKPAVQPAGPQPPVGAGTPTSPHTAPATSVLPTTSNAPGAAGGAPAASHATPPMPGTSGAAPGAFSPLPASSGSAH